MDKKVPATFTRDVINEFRDIRKLRVAHLLPNYDEGMNPVISQYLEKSMTRRTWAYAGVIACCYRVTLVYNWSFDTLVYGREYNVKAFVRAMKRLPEDQKSIPRLHHTTTALVRLFMGPRYDKLCRLWDDYKYSIAIPVDEYNHMTASFDVNWLIRREFSDLIDDEFENHLKPFSSEHLILGEQYGIENCISPGMKHMVEETWPRLKIGLKPNEKLEVQ